MRYELKHDKLAAQVFQRASVLAKNRRRASEVYKHYAKEGHKLNEDDLDRLAEFLPVLEPPDSIKAAIQVAKDEIAKKQKEKIDAANKRAGIFIVLGILAVGFAIYAFYQNGKAQEALREVVRRDLKEVEELVLRLDYEGSWQKLQETAAFGVLRDSVSCQMAEPAFFYAEGGQIDRAKGMLDTIAGYTGNKAMVQLLSLWSESDSTVRLSLLRKSVIALDDSVTYKRLQARYYPEMVFVEGGRFMMGCTGEQGDDCYEDEYPPHWVTLNDYYIAKTETTVWQWVLYDCFLGEPIKKEERGDHPKTMVSWYEAADYADWLNEIFRYDRVYRGDYVELKDRNGSVDTKDVYFIDDSLARSYRLPTEAEWEYAARGDKNSRGYKYAGSNNVDKVGWYGLNSGYKTHPVGQKRSNELGLYDMSGNVHEWCSDWKGVYYDNSQTNPHGPYTGNNRVWRGGSFRRPECELFRVSARNGAEPSRGNENDLGFRLVCVP